LSFYDFHNILSVYGSIQFFVISNSPNIPLLDQPIDLYLMYDSSTVTNGWRHLKTFVSCGDVSN
jgi:hypothetical protein